MTQDLVVLLHGASIMACGVIAVGFLRYWRQTHDRLFALFGLSFVVLGVNRLLLTLIDPANEVRPYVFAMRLLAFALILVAIVDKNVGSRRAE
jgi:hypothetical protein